jgi:IS5 family transposase
MLFWAIAGWSSEPVDANGPAVIGSRIRRGRPTPCGATTAAFGFGRFTSVLTYGLKRSRLKGAPGAKTWTAWAILAYNLDTLAIRAR